MPAKPRLGKKGIVGQPPLAARLQLALSLLEKSGTKDNVEKLARYGIAG